MKFHKVVVTGGSGFIGLQLVKRLIKKDTSEIEILDIRDLPEPYNKYYHYCDILNYDQVLEAIGKAEIVFHLAANPRPNIAEENPQWDLQINAIGTINVAKACLECNSKLILSSTAQINYSPRSCYSISKKTAEEYVLHYVEKNHLNACICRFWNVYGPTQDLGFVIPDLIKKLRDDASKLLIRGNGLAMRDFVFIDDLIDALIFVGKKGESGKIYEIGSGKQITILELAEKIAETMNINPMIIPEQKTERNRLDSPPENLDNIMKLGWKPQYSLEEGLKKIIYH